MEKTEINPAYKSSIESLKKRISDEKILTLNIENKVTLPIKSIGYFTSLANIFLIISILIALFSFFLTLQPLYEFFSNTKQHKPYQDSEIYQKKISELQYINENLLIKIKNLNDNQIELISKNKINDQSNSFIENLELEILNKEKKINNLEEIITGLSSKTIIQQRKLIKAIEMINDLENERQRIISIIKNDNINNPELSKINF